jgi:hypothetical protein
LHFSEETKSTQPSPLLLFLGHQPPQLQTSKNAPQNFTMGYTTFWKSWSPAQLNIAIQAFSLISIFFEGYDQGMLAGFCSDGIELTMTKVLWEE